MDKANQMEFLFEEGGIADDGMNRDPISGNEVPSGSLAEEVRDDIPAQLSEGEYVVPADVVRYYGVRFFEELRDDAKEGLTGMEREGRIGGEPVDMEGDDTELTADEMAELDAIMGMYKGGYVETTDMPRLVGIEDILAEETTDSRSLYDIIYNPRMLVGTPEGAIATTPEMKRDLFRKMGLIQVADAGMGMAVGGFVTEQPTQATDPYKAQTELYRSPAPVAVGNTMQPRGYQEGGAVASLDPSTLQQTYGAGFSFMGSDVTQAMPSTEPTRVVTLYGPNGEVSPPLTLPAMQSQYDLLISQGYSTTPPVQAAPVQAPQVQPVQQDSGGDEYMSPQEYQRELNRIQTGSADFSVQDFERMQSNPLEYADFELNKDQTGLRVATGLAGIIGGPLGAIGAGAAYTAGVLDPIARSRAALEIARSQNLDPERIAALEARINTRIEELPISAKAAMRLGNVATGERFRNEYQAYVDRIQAIEAFDRSPNRPSYLGSATGITINNAIANAAAKLQGPAGDDYARSEASGYTGSAARGVAVGNVSVRDGINGVVVNPETGTVLRDKRDGKTIFRDTEGRTYVRTGFLGRGIEYRDNIVSQEDISVGSSDVPPPETTENVDTGNNDNQSGEGSVICTALFKKGLLSKEIYALDTQYGIMLESTQPEVTYGYRKLATPLANYIQEDTIGATVARTLVAPLAKAWANEMAHQMQPENYKGNLLGKAIIKLGYPVCAFVGKRSKEIVYGT